MVHRTAPLMAATCALIGAALLPVHGRAASSRADSPPAKLFVRAAGIWTGAPEGAKVPPFVSPGAMLIIDGKVAEISATLLPPADAKVVDLGPAVVMPGLVDASTSLAGSSDYLQNAVWKDEAVAAHFDPADSFDAWGDWRTTLQGGVTTVYLSCGERRLVSGQGAVAKLASRDGGATLLVRQAALEINLGVSSLAPPQLVDPPLPPAADRPIVPGVTQLPTTRIGQMLAVREAFDAVRADGGAGSVARGALAAAVQARRPLRIGAEESADLVRATQLARELGHPAVLVGGAEAALVAESLAAARYPVVLEVGISLNRPPVDRLPSPDEAMLRAETAAELVRRGIKVALATAPGHDPAELLMAGALALRGGLTTEQAVAALTRVPAELLGVGHRVGCLMPGKDADFVALSGAPFLRSSHVQKVFVEGRQVADAGATATAGGTVVLKAGTVLTAVGAPIRGGGVAISNGRIISVGADVAVPPGATVIDLGPGAVLTPGFLDANSHLELGEDRTNLSLDFDLVQAVAGAGPEALAVARGGVTTALVQTWQAHQNGSRVVALKTAGATRSARVVDSLAAVKWYWRGPFDPIVTADRLRGALTEGKRYSDAWIKYREDLAKWTAEQKAKGPAPVEPQKPAEEAKEPGEAEKQKKADPITGKWDVTVSGGPMPEPQTGTMRLKLDGEKVTGQFGALFGDDENPRDLSGSFVGKTLKLEVDVEIPIGKPVIDAELDADDHLAGKLRLGDRFAFDFAAQRTDKAFTEVVTVKKAKKEKGADGKPAAPDLKPELEPWRRVFAGELPVLLECDTAIGIRHALKALAEAKVEVVLLGATELLALPRDEWKGVVRGVVVAEQVDGVRLADDGLTRQRYVPAIEFAAQGLPIAFQSHGITSGRGLALNAAFAVRQGMDPGAALRALTIDAARLFHVDDQVGSLEPGKQGDVLAFSGDPFELSSRLLKVFVAGEEIALETKP
jgi:imidazolonepropionase-like amidohydrolase